MRELPVCLSAGKGAEQIQQIPTSCILCVCFDGTDAWWGHFIRVQNLHVQTLNYKLEHCYVCWSQLDLWVHLVTSSFKLKCAVDKKSVQKESWTDGDSNEGNVRCEKEN